VWQKIPQNLNVHAIGRPILPEWIIRKALVLKPKITGRPTKPSLPDQSNFHTLAVG